MNSFTERHVKERTPVTKLELEMVGSPVPISFMQAVVSVLPGFNLIVDQGDADNRKEYGGSFTLLLEETPVFVADHKVVEAVFKNRHTEEEVSFGAVQFRPFSYMQTLFEEWSKPEEEQDQDKIQRLVDNEPLEFASTVGDMTLIILKYAPDRYLAEVFDMLFKDRLSKPSRQLIQHYCKATGLDFNRLLDMAQDNNDLAWEMFQVTKPNGEKEDDN